MSAAPAFVLDDRPDFAEVLANARRIAFERRRPVWLRECGSGEWRISYARCGYYNSTERRIDPDN